MCISDKRTLSEVKETNLAQIPAIFSATVVDGYGIPGQILVNVEVDNTKTVAQLSSDLVSWASDMAPLTQGIITKVTFKMVNETGVDPSTAVGDIEKSGLFNFANATDPYAYGVLIPDVNPTILNAAGTIDLTNADVTAFITLLTTAGTVITAVTKGVRTLTGLIDALIAFRKHRKPLARKTKEV